MITAIFLLLCFGGVVICKNLRNRYTWMFVLTFASLIVLLTAMILYNVKITNYYSNASWEHSVFLWMSKIKIRLYSVIDLLTLNAITTPNMGR